MIILDYKDRRPIYEQLVEKLRDLMVCGALEEDEQLPSVRSLATDLSINPNTIQRAYTELERLGFIYSVKGKGSFVADSGRIRELKLKELKNSLQLWLWQAQASGITRQEVKAWVDQSYDKEGEKE